jgi:Ca-activated chloride channel homolog
MLVLIAITLPLIIMLAAFALDVAWMQLVRTELRTATDAAARAGAKTLSLRQDVPAARAAAKDAARRNRVAGSPLRLRDSEVVFGMSQQSTPTSRFAFRPGGSILNAVQVTGNRNAGSLDGPVGLFMGQVLSVQTFEPSQTAVSTQLDRDICLVVDRSGSMMWSLSGASTPGPECGPPHPTRSRWGALHTAVDAFLDELDNTLTQEQCALASYSYATTECGITYRTSDINYGLTYDYTPIRNEVDRLSSRPVKGRTCISAGINEAITVLTGPLVRPYAMRSIVLMTDGIHNTGTEPIVSARVAASHNIVIDTITFSSDADIPRMQAVAAATGGRHYHAPNAAALVRIFREIAATLPVLTTD